MVVKEMAGNKQINKNKAHFWQTMHFQSDEKNFSLTLYQSACSLF